MILLCSYSFCGNNQLLWDVSINGYLLIVEMNVGCLEMQYKETFVEVGRRECRCNYNCEFYY